IPARAGNNLRVRFCPCDIKGHNPLAEQRDDLFVEGTAAFAGREACDTEQQLGQAHGREVEALHRLGVEPYKHASVGFRPHRLGYHVRIEQDHAWSAGFAGFLSLLISRSRPPNGFTRATSAEPSLIRAVGRTAPSRIARISASVLRPCCLARTRRARCVSAEMLRTTIAGILDSSSTLNDITY